MCRCCRGGTCTAMGVRGTCHRRQERSHRLKLVREGRRIARGARLVENFEMKTTRPACGVVTCRFCWTPRVLTTHAARSMDLAEGRWNRSVARRTRFVGEKRQRAELGERLSSQEGTRPAREEEATEGLESGESLEGFRRDSQRGSKT